MELGFVVMAAMSAVAGLLLRRVVNLRVARWVSGIGYAALVTAAAAIASVFVGIAPPMSAFMSALVPLTIAALVLPFGIAARCGRAASPGSQSSRRP